MINNKIEQVFDFLPTEFIKACDLKPGDVGYINARWTVVLNGTLMDPSYNNEYNYTIDCLDYGTSCLPPEHNVKIIQRSLFNSTELQKFVSVSLEEKRLLDEESRIESEKELKRERAYRELESRLREIDGYDD